MRLEFAYTADDFTEKHIAAAGEPVQTPPLPTFLEKQGSFIGWILFIGLAIGYFLLMQPTKAPPPPAGAAPQPAQPYFIGVLIWVAPLVFLLLMFGYLWFYASLQLREARRVWESNPVARQPKTMDLTETGVRLADALTSTEWRWEAFIKLMETKNLFLLKQGDGTFVMIPKRAAGGT